MSKSMNLNKATGILLAVCIYVFAFAWGYEMVWSAGYQQCREDFIRRYGHEPVTLILDDRDRYAIETNSPDRRSSR